MVKKILVLCTGNSCRSQMAEGYLKAFAGKRAEVFSAGIEAHGVNPRAIASMKEDGMDISRHTSKRVDAFTGIYFDFVITVCDKAKESCPVFPGKAMKFHRDFPDPAKATGTEEVIRMQFARVRDDIKRYCSEFVESKL